MSRRKVEDSLTQEQTQQATQRLLESFKVAELCERFGVTPATVYNWKKGKTTAPKLVMDLVESL